MNHPPKRLYPKCFKAHLDAILFFDFVVENYPSFRTEESFVRLCKTYTSLLCGIHLLEKKQNVDVLCRRFQRFLSLQYYNECNWELLMQTYRNRLQMYSRHVLSLLESEHHETFNELQTKLEQFVFSSLEHSLQELKK